MHTDRSTYAAGDTLWYKAYLTNAQTGKLSPISGNLYVEVIAPADTLVSRQIIKLKGGLGHGDVQLPDSLVSGTYRLRAYTNWMRNFGDAFIFERLFIITDGMPDTVLTSPKAKPLNTDINKATAPAKASLQPEVPFAVKFYPEGGSLVKGITSIVAIKAEAATGKTNMSLIEGHVYNQAGDTVSRFRCDSAGYALITLLPLDAQPFRALLSYGKKKMVVQLPPALASGIVLRATRLDTALQVIISGNTALAKTMPVQQITLVGKHAGKICFSQQLTLTADPLRVTIPFSVFPAGVSSLTLYDEQMHPQAERLVYTEPNNAQRVHLSVATDKTIYQPKEKVTVNFKAVDAGGNPVKANLSVVAVDADAADKSSIAAYMLLQSELKGPVVDAARYFDTTNINRHKQLDMLLLTQGWRNFLWQRLADTNITISYAPEKGFTLKGRLRQKFINKPLVNKQVVASVLQGAGNNHMYLSITDSTGAYRFDSLDVKGKYNVQLSAVNDKQKGVGWLFVDSIKPNILPVKPMPGLDSVIDSGLQPAIVRGNTLAQQRQAMRRGTAIKLNQVTVKKSKPSSPNYIAKPYKPDQVFNISPKDHSYKTVEWFLLQHVKGARASSNDEVTGILVPGLISKIPSPPAMVMLSPILNVDGREIKYEENMAEAERRVIYNLPIENVKKIVFRHLNGTLIKAQQSSVSNLYSGDIYVIELTLKPGALNGPDATKTSMEIEGYYQAREFYKPVYTQPNTSPDLRSTLHWEHSVKTDVQGNATVSYYNADPKIKVSIIAQGITDTGVPVCTVTHYVVK